MDDAPDTKVTESERRYADPNIVKVLNTAREYFELDSKAPILCHSRDWSGSNRYPIVTGAKTR
ncbi:MAG: hypothetical protein ACKVQT_02690 [Burkholderiales bacterium]